MSSPSPAARHEFGRQDKNREGGGLEIVMSLRGDTINGGCLGASRDRTHVGPDVADRGPVGAFHRIITLRRAAEVMGRLTDCGVLVETAR